MFAIIGDTSDGVLTMVQRALTRSRHGRNGVLVIPNQHRPQLTVVPNKIEEHLVTTHKVTAKLTSRKGKLINWLLGDLSSPIRSLAPGQLVSNYSGTDVGFFLTGISSLELATFKAWIAETSRPHSMCQDISTDAWNDARKSLLAELVIHHE